MLVTLSAAKGLARWTQRSFAALRMTGRTPLKPAHGKSYLQMSIILVDSSVLRCQSKALHLLNDVQADVVIGITQYSRGLLCLPARSGIDGASAPAGGIFPRRRQHRL